MRVRSHYDRLLLNLRVLARVPENGRVRREAPGYIGLETSSHFLAVKRLFTGDSRKRSVEDIRILIEDSIA